MKVKTVILICLIGLVVLFAGFEISLAKSSPDKVSVKIGVLSVREIFQNSKRLAGYREKAIAERSRIEAELNQLAREIEAEKAGLATLKPGSPDYLQQVKDLFTKQATSQAQQKFYEQQLALEEQKVIEELYRDILDEAGKVAEEKGLDLVLEKSEPELPAPNANELTLTISTHKLLYSGGCVDVTSDVMARIDQGK